MLFTTRKALKRFSLLLSIDTEKAFDRVHWDYMQMTLSKFGFEGHVKDAILALYSCPSARVYTSSMLSVPFQISNGTRQGCPLSQTIFNPMIEPLAETIRSLAGIRGFRIGSTPHVINLFADDVILMLMDPLTSLPKAHDKLLSFGKVSYYKVNYTKSYILSLGLPPSECLHLQQALPYVWNDNTITYLGIKVTNSTKSLSETNLKTAFTQTHRHKLMVCPPKNCPGWADWQHLKCLYYHKFCIFLDRYQLPLLQNTLKHFPIFNGDSCGAQNEHGAHAKPCYPTKVRGW